MKLFKSPFVDRILKTIGPWLAWLYLHVVGKTQRLQVEGRDYPSETIRGSGPFILAFWHSRLLFPIYLYRGTQFGALVSPSRDGEYIARTMECFGLEPLRGSSKRGAAEGLLKLARYLKKGYCVGVTPDGPRGPREQVQLGVIQLAKVTGIPIIPCSYSSARRIVLNSWDRFVVPLPCSRAVAVYREPIVVPSEASREEMELLRQRLQEEIHEATRRAEAIVRKGEG